MSTFSCDAMWILCLSRGVRWWRTELETGELHISLYVIWSRGNKSDVWNIDFELFTKRGDKFLCFTMVRNIKDCSYLCNQMSDWDGVRSKCSILVVDNEKLKSNIADMRLIPLDRATVTSVGSCSYGSFILHAIALRCRTAPNCKEIAILHCGVAWKLISF